MGLKDFWPAAGVTEIVEENMANAARVHAIERGKDITQCVMIAFGGGAPLHACRLAEKIGVDKIIVPLGAGVGSAIGFLQAPVAYEITKSAAVILDAFDATHVNKLLREMTISANAVVQPAMAKGKPSIKIKADCRYVGQGHEIQISIPSRALRDADAKMLKAAFEKAYKSVYGLIIPNQQVEAITWSVTSSSPQSKMVAAQKTNKHPAPKPLRMRRLFDAASGKLVNAPVYWRFDMKPGDRIKGPAIIAEHETSTILGSRFKAEINALGHIVMEKSK